MKEKATDTPTRILLVDDHPVFCLGMTQLINKEEDLLVVGSEETAKGALKTIETLQPNFLIVDISLKDSDGIELVQEIHRHRPELPMLVLSMYDESLYAERAIVAGARGYVMKQEAINVVVKAIRHVLAGSIYASDDVKEKVFTRLVSKKMDRNDTSALDSLTNRELEVFRLIGNGLSTKEIADRMHLSHKTIGTYRENIKTKLKLKHYTELVHFAVHWSEKIRM
ncbi:MAG: response regulator transcription factor [Desulfobacteraceae bacterium]|jgi:DNA-binding NarL/FixJ family response regulator